MHDTINQAIKLLNENKAMKSVPPKTNNGVIEIGYYVYDDVLWQALSNLSGDIDYMDNYKKIRDKNIEEYTLAECKTFATYLIRGERFCDGLVASAVKDNSILKLLKRYLDLC